MLVPLFANATIKVSRSQLLWRGLKLEKAIIPPNAKLSEKNICVEAVNQIFGSDSFSYCNKKKNFGLVFFLDFFPQYLLTSGLKR